MRLYLVNVALPRRRRGRACVQLVVHARSQPVAEAYIGSRYTKCKIERVIPLDDHVAKHFAVADLF